MFEKLYFEPGKLVGETTLGGSLVGHLIVMPFQRIVFVGEFGNPPNIGTLVQICFRAEKIVVHEHLGRKVFGAEIPYDFIRFIEKTD